jgi:hypothetical protein
MNKVRTAALAIAIAAGGGVSPVAPAQAHGPVYYVDIFYEDQAYTIEVGRDVYYCDGHYAHFGGISGYDMGFYYDC